jgi:hypothetical protein
VLVQATFRAIGLATPALESAFNLVGSPSVPLARLVIGYIARELVGIILRSFKAALRFRPLVDVSPRATIAERFATPLSHLVLSHHTATLAAFKDRSWVHMLLLAGTATPEGCTLRVIWRIWHEHTPVGILNIKLLQTLLGQQKLVILILNCLLITTEIIVGISLCHKVLQVAMLISVLRLIVICVSSNMMIGRLLCVLLAYLFGLLYILSPSRTIRFLRKINYWLFYIKRILDYFGMVLQKSDLIWEHQIGDLK